MNAAPRGTPPVQHFTPDVEPGPSPALPDASTERLFRDLVHDHQHRLYRFVLRKIGHGTDAEDLTQQAFVEAARSYESFLGSSELSTWLYGIAMNLVRNYLTRAPHRRHVFEPESVLEDLASDQPDPSEQLAQSQAVKTLQQEINELPKEMQDVLLLVALDGLSYEEAAVLLAVPIGTIRSRVSRARSALRRQLAAVGL